MEKPSIVPTLLIFTACYAFGFVGALAINSAIAFWYIAVAKPVWAPPMWLLVPVWIVLHGLIAGTICSMRTTDDERRIRVQVVLWITLFGNAIWAVMFFWMHRLMPSLGILSLLWILGIFSAISGGRVRPLAAWLIWPCVLWFTYAGAMNFAIWRLNR
jgi:tryptophan-rich sensory protein